jgi:hypothetical protein
LATLAMLAPLAATPLSAAKRIPVAHLFSWPDGEGSWYFSLVRHQRALTDEEIRAEATRIHGVEELGKEFRELPEFAHVYWLHRDREGFAYPDIMTLERVWTLADRAHLELHLPEEPPGD